MNPDKPIADSNSGNFPEQTASAELSQSQVSANDYHRQIQAFFEGAIDAMVVTDDEGRYVDVNPAACTLFGLPKEDLLGRSIADFALPGSDFPILRRDFPENERLTGEFRVRRARTVLDVEYAATAHFLPHRHLLVLRDITSRKQMELALHQLNQELELRVERRTAALQQTNEQLRAEIRERQQVEASLRHSQQQLAAITKNIPGGVYRYIYHTDGSVSMPYASEGYFQLLGIEPQELMTHPELALAMIHPSDRDRFYQAERAAKETLEPGYLEYRLISTSGEVKWIRDHARFSRSENGDLIVDGVDIDITERKQIEVDLVRSQTKLDNILNSAIAAIISFRVFAERTWQYDFFSKGCEAIYGYTVPELMADQSLWKTRVLAEDLEGAILPGLEDIFASRSIKVEYRLYHKDGTLRWICGTLTSRRDEAADCWIVTAVDTDITERKQAEAALRESEERFRMLIRELNVGVLLQGRNAEILLSNPKALELLGLTEDQLLGKTSFDPDWQVIHEDGSPFPGSTHPVPVAIATRQPVRNVVMGVRRPKIEGVATGDLVWLLVNAKPQFAPDGNIGHVICTFSDITERKQAEEALRQQAFREHLLGAITANIRQSLNLDEILNTTVAEVRQFLACDRSLIYRLDDKSGVVIVESVSPHCFSILGMQIQDPCLSAKQCIEPYTRGHFQAVADIHSAGLRACYVDSLAQFQVRANLVVPILQGNNLWGLLVAQHCANPRQWQATEIDLLRQLATQVGIAIQQSQLYEQVQQLNANLESQVQERTAQLQQALEFEALVKRIADKVRDSLDENQILQTAVQELAQVLEVYCCDAAWYDLEQGTVTVCYEYIRSEVPPAKGLVLRLDDIPEVHNQILQGQYVQFCPVSQSPNLPRTLKRLFTILGCPLMDNEGVFGNLWLFKSHQDCFNELEIRLVQQVASQCAIALRQSRLYQAAQRQVEELERLNRLKDDFLSTISHELRTPMSSILMATEMLEISLDRVGVLDAESNPINRYLQILKDECQRELRLINDLLDLTRLDAGTEPLMLSAIQLQGLIPYQERPGV